MFASGRARLSISELDCSESKLIQKLCPKTKIIMIIEIIIESNSVQDSRFYLNFVKVFKIRSPEEDV